MTGGGKPGVSKPVLKKKKKKVEGGACRGRVAGIATLLAPGRALRGRLRGGKTRGVAS
jgi:hypothetical protein